MHLRLFIFLEKYSLLSNALVFAAEFGKVIHPNRRKLTFHHGDPSFRLQGILTGKEMLSLNDDS